jgi:hypothetical protein
VEGLLHTLLWCRWRGARGLASLRTVATGSTPGSLPSALLASSEHDGASDVDKHPTWITLPTRLQASTVYRRKAGNER